jgi:peptide chain release factor subunit 1
VAWNKYQSQRPHHSPHHSLRYGFIVMDGNGTLFGTLSGNTREILHKFTGELGC